jgi:hypothetical protein
MALRTDLAFDFGEDWNIALSCFQADGVTALDLTGASALLVIGGTVSAPTVSISGIVGALPTGGQVSFHVPPALQTPLAGVAGLSAPYTIRVTLAGGAVTDQAYGNLKIRAA